MTLFIRNRTYILARLHKFGDQRLRNKIMGVPVFSFNEFGGSPQRFNELKKILMVNAVDALILRINCSFNFLMAHEPF